MPEELKELIEKIQIEGIQAADDKAKEIEQKALKEAEAIIEEAKLEAEKIIGQAKEQSLKTSQAANTLLKQAARDALLNLRKEINSILDKIIISNVHHALKAQEIAKSIVSLIKEHSKKDASEIFVYLSKEDAERIEKDLLAELGQKIKEGITIRPQEEIKGGFKISFDAGKSYFDFTDKAIAEYIGLYVRPKLKKLLDEAVVVES